jgi:hypothetical protein
VEGPLTSSPLKLFILLVQARVFMLMGNPQSFLEILLLAENLQSKHHQLFSSAAKEFIV